MIRVSQWHLYIPLRLEDSSYLKSLSFSNNIIVFYENVENEKV